MSVSIFAAHALHPGADDCGQHLGGGGPHVGAGEGELRGRTGARESSGPSWYAWCSVLFCRSMPPPGVGLVQG